MTPRPEWLLGRIEPLTVQEAFQDYTAVWNAVYHLHPTLEHWKAANLVSLIVGLCPGCYEAPKHTCTCMRDD
jgi:hypothetical protein